MEKEKNHFEDQETASRWSTWVENETGRSRDREIYPFLYAWTSTHRPQTILDIGSGQGICSSKINLDACGAYIGVEPSVFLVERAQELYTDAKRTFVVGSIYEIPLADKSVDACFSVGVWFHIQDLDRAHKEIARVLKPRGRFLIITASPDAYHVWESYFNNPERTKDGKMTEGRYNLSSAHTFTNSFIKNTCYWHSKKDILDPLTRYSFETKEIKQFGLGGGEHRPIWLVVDATLDIK